MTAGAALEAISSGRGTVAVGLPIAERNALGTAFLDAGFAVRLLDRPSELPSLATTGTAFAAAILDVGREPAAVVDMVRRLRAGGVRVPVVYVTTDAGLEALSESGVEAADEIVVRPFDVDTLRWRVEAMAIRAQVEPAPDGVADTVLSSGRVDAAWAPQAPIFAVFSPKGGIGKTTIATNLAVALQSRKHRRVLLVDADTVTGHVGLSLGLDAGRTLADSWHAELGGDPHESLVSLASAHPSGVRVVSLASNPLTAPHLDPERVAEAILDARGSVDAVIVDVHSSYSDLNLAVFTIADRILVPVTPDLPAIRATMQLQEVARELGVGDRLAMIVNRAKSGVSVADLERTTGMKAFAEIRSAGLLMVWAANAGKTVVEKYPREKVTADFDAVAERLLLVTGSHGVATATHDQRFGLGGLFRRVSAEG